MNKRAGRAFIDPLKLAAVTILCLGLSTNDNLDAATSWPASSDKSGMTVASLNIVPNSKQHAVTAQAADPSHVLNDQDAALYQAAFAAQEKSDWKAADDALLQIKDKRLIGHVLADRYQRHAPTLAEAQQWLASYSNLPEADSIYRQAKHLPGGAKAPLAHPITAIEWSHGNGFDTSSGFHVASQNDNTRGKVHINNKIIAALRRDDPMKAREILITELQHRTLSVTDASEIMAHIAAAFFYQDDIEHARPMAHMAAANGVPLGLWIDGLSAWKQHNYIFASRSFAALAQAPGLSQWDRAAASYWAYRAAKRTNDNAGAAHWMAETVKYPRSFYGALASLSGKHANQSWKMPELNAKNIAMLSQQNAGWQALALVQVGKSDLAERELRCLNLTNHDMQNATLALAEKAHMPALTMQLGGVATNDNGQLYEAAQYPLPPWQPASGFKVDRALIYAVMKHESEFDPTAVSGSGACGLMQIMPATARLIGNDNPKGNRCSTVLFDPATNMEMGQKYVRVLADAPMIGDNLLLLLAAYNGGPGNLSHWLDGDDRRDPLLFIESLPMRETHDYVQKVLVHYWMYRSRLSEPETTAAQLARGEWPRYALRDTPVRQADVGQKLELVSVKPMRVAAAQ